MINWSVKPIHPVFHLTASMHSTQYQDFYCGEKIMIKVPYFCDANSSYTAEMILGDHINIQINKGIPVIKRRYSNGILIIIMRIPISGKTVFIWNAYQVVLQLRGPVIKSGHSMHLISKCSYDNLNDNNGSLFSSPFGIISVIIGYTIYVYP